MPLARHDVTGKGHATDDLFLLTCLLRGMTFPLTSTSILRHVSTHMPLARHDRKAEEMTVCITVSTHMPLARHDEKGTKIYVELISFYSHASCEA